MSTPVMQDDKELERIIIIFAAEIYKLAGSVDSNFVDPSKKAEVALIAWRDKAVVAERNRLLNNLSKVLKYSKKTIQKHTIEMFIFAELTKEEGAV